MLALAMCGHSPSKIGALVWQEHPTLRALIKMVTANRFRFPTVDCDENERTEMKKLEQAARDEVIFFIDWQIFVFDCDLILIACYVYAQTGNENV